MHCRNPRCGLSVSRFRQPRRWKCAVGRIGVANTTRRDHANTAQKSRGTHQRTGAWGDPRFHGSPERANRLRPLLLLREPHRPRHRRRLEPPRRVARLRGGRRVPGGERPARRNDRDAPRLGGRRARGRRVPRRLHGRRAPLWSERARTISPTFSCSLREHRVPVTTAVPVDFTLAVGSIVMVTIVKSVNSNAPTSQNVSRGT